MNDPNGPDGRNDPHDQHDPNGSDEVKGQAGHACPACAAPRRPDGTPSCGCTRRAAEALRDARSAEAAAAEDFDPLRIRPYVELGSGEPDETIRLRAVPQAETVLLAAMADGLEPTAPAPDTEANGQTYAAVAPGTERPRRRRRTVLLAAAGGVVAVVAAAGFAGGLFSYDPPQRDDALPQDIRASVPEESTPAGTPAPVATVSEAAPAASAPAPPIASPTPPPSPSSASPTPSTSATATATATATPTPTAPTATPSPTSDSSPVQRRAQILRPGDKGREVTELQLRLRQLSLYLGPTNGDYDNQVENSVRTYQFDRGIKEDEPGVYGLATRARLESETKEP